MSKNILVIDDEEDIRKSFVSALKTKNKQGRDSDHLFFLARSSLDIMNS